MSAVPLTRLFYVSEIVHPLSDVDVEIILGASQIKNRRGDITGMLVQSDEHFLQVLEGRAESVAALMRSILKDARHRDVREVLILETCRRHFARWAMGLARRPDMGAELSRLHRAGALARDEAMSLAERLLSPAV